ncbi:MAG: hypothetical protein IV090_14640 [Candidatus Sericytochromatia bacterium]|nr:hypothetical protein [Candidatus Sericytochromatia bacterium]
MIKDRKFAAGLAVGIVAGAALSFLQPLVAADQASNNAQLLKEVQDIRKYTLDMARNVRNVSTEMTEIKKFSQTTSEGIKTLSTRGEFK